MRGVLEIYQKHLTININVVTHVSGHHYYFQQCKGKIFCVLYFFLAAGVSMGEELFCLRVAYTAQQTNNTLHVCNLSWRCYSFILREFYFYLRLNLN